MKTTAYSTAIQHIRKLAPGGSVRFSDGTKNIELAFFYTADMRNALIKLRTAGYTVVLMPSDPYSIRIIL